MSTQTLKGRVINKHKTAAEWYLDVYISANSTTLRDDPFIPYNGELIIYDPDSVYTERRIKFGDGATNVVALPFYQGSDGDTPVRGVDYWTEADKAEIKAYVDDAILNGEW